MDEKDNELLNESEETTIEISEEQDYEIENEDYLSTSISIDEINNLNEDEIRYLIEKIDVELEKYEDEIMNLYEEDESDEDAEEDSKENEYKRLKELKKVLYKNLRNLKKIRKETGIFGLVPFWYFIIAFFFFIFTILPLSPFFPLQLCSIIVNAWPNLFSSANQALIITFVVYNLVVVLAGLIPLLIYLKKGKKSKEKHEIFKKMLIIFIINIVLMLPSVISYIVNFL